MSGEISNQTLEVYIDKLIAMYGLFPIVDEKALRIQFEHGLYAECVLEIMRKMGIKNKLKVTCYADYKYPCNKSVARISLPQPLPLFGTQNFNSMRIHIEMKEGLKKQFYSFVAATSHELSHLLMHGTRHELYQSEVATDLCVLVFGFTDFVIKGKRMSSWSVFGTEIKTLGYLSEEQMHYSISYIERKRAALKERPVEQPKKNEPTSLFKEFFRKFF